MALANCGLPVGTEIIVPAAGALAGTGQLSSWYLAALVATLGELTGGFVLYSVGYHGGRPFVVRWGRFFKIDEKKLDAFQRFYERYGNIVVFVCRFIPFVRGVSALPAGVSRMRALAFGFYTLLGSAIFCFGLSWLGFVFGRHFDELTPLIRRSSTSLIALLVVLGAAWVAYRLVRSRRAGEQA